MNTLTLDIIKTLPVIGSGETRVVCDYGDKVVKYAKNSIGKAANFKEKFLYDFTKNILKNSIVPECYGISEDGTYIVVQKCEQCSEVEFVRMYPFLKYTSALLDVNRILDENESEFVIGATDLWKHGIYINPEIAENIGKINGRYVILDSGNWTPRMPEMIPQEYL